MKAFVVKYHGPTNTLPSRWSVKCADNKRKFYNDSESIFNYSLYMEQIVRNYVNENLCIDPGFTLAQGTLPNGDIVVVVVV